MRRQTQDDVTAAAARRLELLRRELEQAGLTPLEAPVVEERPEAPDDLAPPSAVARPGRHSRPGRSGRLASWMHDRLPETLRGRVTLSGGPVLLVVGLVALAVVSSAFAVLRMSAGDGEVVPAASTSAARSSAPLTDVAPAPSDPSGAPTAASSGASGPVTGSATGSATGSVTVDVAGKVRRPGVAELPAGARVIDAVEHAGGARRGVDLTSLNLARVLVDGEQILVGAPAPAGPAAGAVSTAAPSTQTLVNLNTATEEQLDTLPGVGPVTAQKILEWRGAHGAFSAVDELLEVDGIGEKTLADLAPLVTL